MKTHCAQRATKRIDQTTKNHWKNTVFPYYSGWVCAEPLCQMKAPEQKAKNTREKQTNKKTQKKNCDFQTTLAEGGPSRYAK